MDNVWNPISDAVATVAGWIQAHIDYARIWIQLKWLQVATWFYDNVWNPIVDHKSEIKVHASLSFVQIQFATSLTAVLIGFQTLS